jgi:transcriptional regulator with XRE-family HTH domain
VLHPQRIQHIDTYRDAVRVCFELRRVRGMTRRSVAELAGIHAPHISEYLSDDASNRDLPAKHIRAFEWVCGNTAISQWMALRAKLTVLEEMQAMRAA